MRLNQLRAVVSLLAGPRIIQGLDFGGFTLLRPEVLSPYAGAVARRVRKHPQELGCIREDQLLTGDLDYQDFKRLARDDEAVVLRTLLDTFITREWCLRQPCDGSAMLTGLRKSASTARQRRVSCNRRSIGWQVSVTPLIAALCESCGFHACQDFGACDKV